MVDFSYRSYVDLLRYIRGLGREICPLRDAPADGAVVILRHDIDYSMSKAREMAAIEQAEGVRSTFMVLLTSPYYNLLQAENRRALHDIASMGHEVGLHYDTDACVASDAEGRVAEVVRQARFLESCVGIPVSSIAQHNPSVVADRIFVPGYRDSYGDQYFRNLAYLSDSRRLWGAPDVYEFFREHARSQLLVHPLWWFDESVNRVDAFGAVRAAIVRDIEARLADISARMEADERRLRGR